MSSYPSDSFTSFVKVIPQNSYAMRGIFATKTNNVGQELWSDVFKANEANACHRETILQLGPKTRRELPLHNFRIKPKVGEDAPADNSLNSR